MKNPIQILKCDEAVDQVLGTTKDVSAINPEDFASAIAPYIESGSTATDGKAAVGPL